MEENLDIKGHNHLIKGHWIVDGIAINFQGELLNQENNKVVLNIEYSFPLSFQRKYGKEAMEIEIISSVKESYA